MRVAKARKFIKDAPNSHVYEGRNFVLLKRALITGNACTYFPQL